MASELTVESRRRPGGGSNRLVGSQSIRRAARSRERRGEERRDICQDVSSGLRRTDGGGGSGSEGSEGPTGQIMLWRKARQSLSVERNRVEE